MLLPIHGGAQQPAPHNQVQQGPASSSSGHTLPGLQASKAFSIGRILPMRMLFADALMEGTGVKRGAIMQESTGRGNWRAAIGSLL